MKKVEDFAKEYEDMPIKSMIELYEVYKMGYYDGKADALEEELAWLTDANHVFKDVTVHTNR